MLCIFIANFNLSAQVSVKTTKLYPTYEIGETASFEILSNASGPATYQFVYDDTKSATAELPITLSAGQASIVTYSLAQPGGITCKVKQNGQVVRTLALFSHDKIQPSRSEPSDFDQFWNSQKQILASVPINPLVTYHAESATSTTYRVSLGNIEGRRVYGWLSVPKAAGQFPAIISFPSYGNGPVYPVDYLSDQLGVLGFALTIHNTPPDQTDPNAYFPNDNSNPNSYYYRYAVLAGLRVVDYLHTRPDFDGAHIAAFGESQGGGLATMVAGLDQRVDVLMTGIDALCEHSAYLDGKASGFPYYLRTSDNGNTSYFNAVASACKYYDATYFMSRFKGQYLDCLGHTDDICPPATSLTKNNQATNKSMVIHALDRGHSTPVYYYKAFPDFIRLHYAATNTPPNNPWTAQTKGYDLVVPSTLNGTTSAPLQLNTSIVYDGSPLAQTSILWEKISGPGSVSFGSINAMNSSASFSQPGTYVLKLTVNDLSRISAERIVVANSDFVTVQVTGGGVNPSICSSAGQQPWEHWIDRVSIGSFSNASAKEGYINFTQLAIPVTEGSTYPLQLTPGTSFSSLPENWRVWVDWNNDLDFGDAGELAFESSSLNAVFGQLVIPAGTAGKQVRLRVAMKNGSMPTSCENFLLGEVEDYQLTIGAPVQNCTLTLVANSPICNQNGTTSNASDDTWSVQLLGTNSNTSLVNYRISYNNQTLNAAYGVGSTISSLPMNGQSITFTATDISNPTCSSTITVQPPAPCAVACQINYTEVSRTCSTNNTVFTASDDTWDLVFQATNPNTTFGNYTLSYAGSSLTRTYGQNVTIQRPMNGQALVLTLTDGANASCSRTITVQPPASCAQACQINYTEISRTCSTNNTPFDASDDTWSLVFQATNQNPALTNYTLNYAGNTLTRSYGQTVTIQQPMNGISLAVTLTEASGQGCSRTISVQPPAPCVQTPTVCQVNYAQVSKTCSVGTTPYLATDDFWTLVFNVSNQNATLTNYILTYGTTTLFKTYGQPVSIQQPMNGQSLVLTITDQLNPSCSRVITVAPPAPCVQTPPTPCQITFTEVQKVCSVGTTPFNASDDTWTLSFKVTNTNTAATSYILSYFGSNFTRSYGTTYTLSLPMNGQSLTLGLRDVITNTCSSAAVVAPPAPCVQTPGPSPVGYCSVASNYPWEEWIAGVRLNPTWIKYSGKEGYADFTSTIGTIKSGNNEIRVLNQFSYITSTIYTKIWIDIDKNGVFGNLASELIVSKTTAPPPSKNQATSTTIGSFSATPNMFPGVTRMRIIISTSPITDACTTVGRGEIEDYTVAMETAALLSNPANATQLPLPNDIDGKLLVYPNPSSEIIHINVERYMEKALTIHLIGNDLKVHHTLSFDKLKSDVVSIPVNDMPSGMYFLHIVSESERPIVEKVMIATPD
jgi:cephalosporin-C deacetylase